MRPDWAWRDIAATPERDLVRETSALIERAVLRAVPANVKEVALPLSGGLDSRLLAAVLARHGVPVRAYNIDSGHEAAIARQVASTLKLPLRTLGMLDRPAAIPEAHRAVDGAYHVNQVWGWEMARRAAEEDGCDALFDGLAFDAILGAVHHLAGTDADSLAANLEANYADVCEGTLTRLVSPAAAATYGTVRSSPARLAREALEQAGARASDYFLMTNRVRKYTFGYCLANLHPLPGRFPYVTTALLEHCLGLPRELRLEYNLYRRLYRELFPELAAIPWAKTMLPGAAA